MCLIHIAGCPALYCAFFHKHIPQLQTVTTFSPHIPYNRIRTPGFSTKKKRDRKFSDTHLGLKEFSSKTDCFKKFCKHAPASGMRPTDAIWRWFDELFKRWLSIHAYCTYPRWSIHPLSLARYANYYNIINGSTWEEKVLPKALTNPRPPPFIQTTNDGAQFEAATAVDNENPLFALAQGRRLRIQYGKKLQ